MNSIFLAQMTSNDSVFITASTTIVGALVSAVVFLFRLREVDKDRTTKELEECRKDREQLWGKISDLQITMAKLMKGE